MTSTPTLEEASVGEELDSDDVLDELTEDTQDDGEDTLDDSEQTEDTDADEQEERPADVEGWVAAIQDDPDRIIDVPRKLKGSVFTAAVEAARREASDTIEKDLLDRLPTLQQEAFEQGRVAMEFEMTMQAIHARVKEDSSYLSELSNGGEEGEALLSDYTQWRRQSPQRQKRELQVDRSGVTQQEWADLNKRLETAPEAVEKLASMGKHARDLRFYRTALRVLDEQEGAAKASKEATRREAAAKTRKELPKPDTSKGKSTGPLTRERLKAMTQAESAEMWRKSPEAMEKALASPDRRSVAP